jgi:hypothetical protein
MAKRKRDDTDETKAAVQKTPKRYKVAQNKGKGPLRFYKWLVTTKNGLYGTNVADWKLVNSGPWGLTWQNGLPVMHPRFRDPEEEFGWFSYFPTPHRNGMDCYLRVKLDAHQLDYIEKKGKRVKDAIQQASGIYQGSLLNIVVDYSAPSLVWIRYHINGSPDIKVFPMRHVSLEEARTYCVSLSTRDDVVKWRPPHVFEMVLNPRTLVVSGPMPKAPPRRK